MSSGQAKQAEAQAVKEWHAEFTKLSEISENVLCIIPRTPESHNLFWLWENREKIIRNRKMIDLIG